MDRKYRVVSRAILATAMIVPAFIATKVAAENRGWNTSPYRSNYYNYGYNRNLINYPSGISEYIQVNKFSEKS